MALPECVRNAVSVVAWVLAQPGPEPLELGQFLRLVSNDPHTVNRWVEALSRINEYAKIHDGPTLSIGEFGEFIEVSVWLSTAARQHGCLKAKQSFLNAVQIELTLRELHGEVMSLKDCTRNDLFLPRSSPDGGADPEGGMLELRLVRAIMNQVSEMERRSRGLVEGDGTDETWGFVSVGGSRFEIWASTVRDTIEEAANLAEQGRQDQALACLRSAANSITAFGRSQRVLEAYNRRLAQIFGENSR